MIDYSTIWENNKADYSGDTTAHEIIQLSKKYIKGKVLDIGAGSGKLLQLLNLNGKVSSIHGIDIAPKQSFIIEGSSSYRAYVKGEKTGYGALSWWDYGNWIIVSGRTPALCTPIDQDSGKASGIFTETDMSKAVNKLKELQLKYVIIDEDMFKDKLYPIIRSAKADGVTIKDMFMYRLFYLNDVKGVELVWNDSSLKVFEVKW